MDYWNWYRDRFIEERNWQQFLKILDIAYVSEKEVLDSLAEDD